MVLRFKAKVERAIVPAGLSLADPKLVGSVSSGRAVFAIDDHGKGEQIFPAEFRVTDDRTQFSLRKLSLDGAIAAGFDGGYVEIQDGNLSVSNGVILCPKCTSKPVAEDALLAISPLKKRPIAYAPGLFLLSQNAPHRWGDGRLKRSLTEMVGFSNTHPVKAMVSYYDLKAGTPKDCSGTSELPIIRLVVSLSDLSLSAQ
ncbi:MAG: hypothetical protein R3E48_09175 [Burkholderiaceae bacterium]